MEKKIHGEEDEGIKVPPRLSFFPRVFLPVCITNLTTPEGILGILVLTEGATAVKCSLCASLCVFLSLSVSFFISQGIFTNTPTTPAASILSPTPANTHACPQVHMYCTSGHTCNIKRYGDTNESVAKKKKKKGRKMTA